MTRRCVHWWSSARRSTLLTVVDSRRGRLLLRTGTSRRSMRWSSVLCLVGTRRSKEMIQSAPESAHAPTAVSTSPKIRCDPCGHTACRQCSTQFQMRGRVSRVSGSDQCTAENVLVESIEIHQCLFEPTLVVCTQTLRRLPAPSNLLRVYGHRPLV